MKVFNSSVDRVREDKRSVTMPKYIVSNLQGNLFGISRSTCDTRFWHDLQDICRTDPTVNYDWWCKVISTDYYLAVSLAGSSHYEDPSSSWCCENWVSYCLEEERPSACAFWNDPWWNYAK